MLRLPNRLIFFGLIGCAQAPDELGCHDPACRTEIILTAHDVNGAEVPGHLAALSDELERIGVISALVDHDPEGASAYCSLLPRSISRRRCEHVSGRSHLWDPPKQTVGVGSRAGIGPVSAQWGAGDLSPSSLIYTRGVSGSFGLDVDPHATAWGRAMQAAEAGEVEPAAKACASIRGGLRWRYDCFFSAAVAHVEVWDRAHLSDTVALCGGSGTFRGLCLGAVVNALASAAPPSDDADPLTWAPVMMRAYGLREALSDSPLQADALDRFWALVSWHSVAKATAMSGDLIDVLPLAAGAHVRAAMAASVLARVDVPLDLGSAVGLVNTVLDRRANQGGQVAATPNVQHAGAVSDMWPFDAPGEAHIAAVSYLGASRRTIASDPSTDTVLVVLEAAARLKPSWKSLIDEAKTHGDQRVRWTALRLADQLGSEALGQAPTSVSSTPVGQNSGL